MSALSLFEPPSDSTPPVVMRPYQSEAIGAIEAAMDKGAMRGLIVLPTGTGKTSVFTELIKRLRSHRMGAKALIVAHQIELLDQAQKRIQAMVPGAIVSIEAGDMKADPSSHVVVAGVQSIGRPGNNKLSWFKPDLIIIDEAHHAPADSYQHVLNNFGVYEGECHLLGVTATPHRMDNKPLHGSDVAIFQDILYTYTIRKAIAEGYLCNVRGYRAVADGLDLSNVKKTAGDYNQGQLQEIMNDDELNAFAVEKWFEVASNRRTVVFCTGVEHADDMAEAFRSRGVRAESVNGKMDRESRDAVIRRFRSGETQVLTNMNLLTEGVDIPEISAILMLRPTQSWTLYTQMLGRGLRPAPGKPDCIVIDIAGNSELHQLGKNPPISAAGVFELPLGLDLGGQLVTEALELFEELSDEQRAKLFKRVINIDGLKAALTEVDILSELETPEELTGVSAWTWLKLSDQHYMLGCGSTQQENHCRLDMIESTLGRFELTIQSSERREVHDVGDDLKGAFQLAEQIAQRIWPNVGAVANSNARWRKEKPTEKQIAFLIKLGVPEADVERLTKGTASQLLSKMMANKNPRRRR